MTTTANSVLMNKPTSPVDPPSEDDIEVGTRAVRALKDSPLHVFVLRCLSDDPELPDTEYCVDLAIVAVTDGDRGFLVMTDDYAPPKSDTELAELVADVYEGAPRGDDYVTCIATVFEGPDHTPGVIDLSEPETTRAVIEETYERAFEGKPSIDHASFFAHFARHELVFQNEEAERRFCRLLDGGDG